MNNAKHTPGPWCVGSAADNRVAVYGAVECVAIVGEEGYPIVDADARLIAAAPDLLEALEELLAHEGETQACGIGVEIDSEALERAKRKAEAAIAKARGNG